MAKPEFQAIAGVECWEYRAKLGESRRSLCLFHHQLAAGDPIRQALAELSAEANDTRRSLSLLPTTRLRAVRTLKLRLVPPSSDLLVFCILSESNQAQATIEMTAVGQRILLDALANWLQGGEDFGVAPARALHADSSLRELGARDRTSPEIWFWGPSMEP